jgi:pimeloyl-ACP methyl ester carboxylesterase
LEEAARSLGKRFGARMTVTTGEALLANNYPMIHAVGRASPREPRLIDLVWGKEDALLPPEDAYKFNECIAGSEVLVIERCGHLPVVERNEEFNKALLTFLAEIDLYYDAESR